MNQHKLKKGLLADQNQFVEASVVEIPVLLKSSLLPILEAAARDQEPDRRRSDSRSHPRLPELLPEQFIRCLRHCGRASSAGRDRLRLLPSPPIGEGSLLSPPFALSQTARLTRCCLNGSVGSPVSGKALLLAAHNTTHLFVPLCYPHPLRLPHGHFLVFPHPEIGCIRRGSRRRAAAPVLSARQLPITKLSFFLCRRTNVR